MDEASTKLIGELAAQFGTTVEHLWDVLIKQAPISGLCNLILLGMWVTGLVWLYRVIKAKTKDTEYDLAEWEAQDKLLAWAVWGMSFVVTLLVAEKALPNIVAGFFNPEYWALRQILR